MESCGGLALTKSTRSFWKIKGSSEKFKANKRRERRVHGHETLEAKTVEGLEHVGEVLTVQVKSELHHTHSGRELTHEEHIVELQANPTQQIQTEKTIVKTNVFFKWRVKFLKLYCKFRNRKVVSLEWDSNLNR
jgi:hypothetical protein